MSESSGSAPSRSLRLPDFLIAGAPRSATTWLYVLADRHPAIAMAKPVRPEPKFFLVNEIYERGLQYYADTWFGGMSRDVLAGEKSTNYLESKNAAARIARDLPDVRIVFLLRHPVERAYSNYLWSKANGLETETFERALALEEERERHLPAALRYARPFSYFSRGLYAAQLREYFSLLRRDQIMVLRQDDVVNSPRSVAERLFRFLGVTPMPELADGLGRINSSMRVGETDLDPATRTVLLRRYQEANRSLAALLGEDFPAWDR